MLKTKKQHKTKLQRSEDHYNKALMLSQEGKISQAAAEYQKAADLGLMQAQHNLALLYVEGTEDLPADLKKAANLFQKAAEQGCEQAKNNIGILKTTGIGTKQKLNQAYSYLSTSNAPIAQQLKKQVTEYLATGMSFWKASETKDTKYADLVSAFRCLAETKKRTLGVKDLQLEFVEAEKALVKILPLLLEHLDKFLAAQPLHKMLYEIATNIATAIQKYDDALYKGIKDRLKEIRKETWKNLSTEDKHELKQAVASEREAKHHVETDPQAIFKEYRI